MLLLKIYHSLIERLFYSIQMKKSFVFLTDLCTLSEFPSLIDDFQFYARPPKLLLLSIHFRLLTWHNVLLRFQIVFSKSLNYLHDILFLFNEGKVV